MWVNIGIVATSKKWAWTWNSQKICQLSILIDKKVATKPLNLERYCLKSEAERGISAANDQRRGEFPATFSAVFSSNSRSNLHFGSISTRFPFHYIASPRVQFQFGRKLFIDFQSPVLFRIARSSPFHLTLYIHETQRHDVGGDFIHKMKQKKKQQPKKQQAKREM